MPKKGIDILVLEEGTPLAFVNECLREGEFIPPTEPVAPGEKIIGELTIFEKAVYTASAMIADSNNAMLDKAKKDGKEPDLLKVEQNRRNVQALTTLFWACVGNRFETVVFIGVREGYKVVRLPQDDVNALLKEIQAGADNPVMVIVAPFADFVEGDEGCENYELTTEEKIAKA